MITKKQKISFHQIHGGKYQNYICRIPQEFCQALGITTEDREIEISLDGDKIIITKSPQ